MSSQEQNRPLDPKPSKNEQPAQPVHIPKPPSEEEMKVWGEKVRVHHGTLASEFQHIHQPEHHNPHALVNYAKVAKEELAEPAADIKLSGLLQGDTGIPQYDEVKHHLPSSSP